jgi:flagellar hook-associated protein 1
VSTLFSLLNTAGQTLNSLERLMSASQNNVANASTPGYARQDGVSVSLAFQSENNLTGGIRAGTPRDSRSLFAEQYVRNQASILGFQRQVAAGLAPLESLFDLTGKTGISGALNQLFQSFSAWSASPASISARQAVLSAAEGVALSFRQSVQHVDETRTSAERNLASAVSQINQLAAKVQEYNKSKLKTPTPDAGQEANLHATLEELAELTNFVPLFQEDATVTLLLGGQTPLVIGAQHNPIALSYAPPDGADPLAPPLARITDSEDRDITRNLTEGTLGGWIRLRNTEIPALIGGGKEPGSLNVLARQIADRVNQLLVSGQTSEVPPSAGTPVFRYNPEAGITNIAATLSLNSSITPAQLAPIDPVPPMVGNGIALRLAGLATSDVPEDRIEGAGILEYFGSIATRTGNAIAAAREAVDRTSGQLALAKSFRNELSGVSLDEEAIRLVELQRTYQAASRVVTIVSDMTDSLMRML